MRTAMDKQNGGVFLALAGLPALWLQGPALHWMMIRAFEPELLALRHIFAFQFSSGEMRQANWFDVGESLLVARKDCLLNRLQITNDKDVIGVLERRLREEKAVVRENLNSGRSFGVGESGGRCIPFFQFRLLRRRCWCWGDRQGKHFDLCLITGSEVKESVIFGKLDTK